MSEINKVTTKEKILKTAAKMFSERGFDRVTVREIAKDIGLNSGSLYNHFISKDEMFRELCNFYSEQRRKKYPDLKELLKLAETEPPHEVLMKAEYHYDDDIRELLDQILITASRRICYNDENAEFIRENIFDSISNILKPLLEHMVELKKIKPFDIDTFINVMSFYCFSAAALNNSPFKTSVAQYQAGMNFLFSMIVPIET
jgi:AcrR family transcriptional regulator